MAMTREEQIAAIERDRNRREAGLSLFLLALAEKSRRYVNRALRVGTAWAGILRGVLLGDEALDLRGGVPVLSRAMAETHHAGVARVGRLVNVTTAPVLSLDDLARTYAPRAENALERIRGGLHERIDDAIAGAAEADRISADVLAVSEAYRNAGWAADNPYAAATEATGTVTASYASGMAEAYGSEPVAAVLTGLRFVTVRDERRTEICEVREGVTLPLDHWWWFAGNYPPCHWGCRSLAMPLTGGAVRFTENPPTEPPASEGWGQWAGMLTAFRGVGA